MNMPAEVAQLVEHGTENAGVDSSILSLGTTGHIPIYFVATAPLELTLWSSIADILPTMLLTSPLS